MIFLLQSRAVILTALIVIVFELGRTVFISKNYLTAKFIIAFITFGIILVFALSSERFKPLNTAIENKAGIEMKSANVRIEIWSKSIQIIKENILFGVGTGDVKNELIRHYDTESLEVAKEKGFNAHNQFIETFIGMGLIGFLTLVLILVLPYFERGNYSNWNVEAIFLLIIIIGFIFESMLNTIAGVSFFAFFYSLLIRK
jgi:O-antigen ligase